MTSVGNYNHDDDDNDNKTTGISRCFDKFRVGRREMFSLSRDANGASNKQFLRLRKSKSDSELSGNSRHFADMGSTVSRSKSLHNFEMLTIEKVDDNLPEMTDDSADDYLPLETSDDDFKSEIDVSEIRMNELPPLNGDDCYSSIKDQGQVQTQYLESSAVVEDFQQSSGSKRSSGLLRTLRNSLNANSIECVTIETHPNNNAIVDVVSDNKSERFMNDFKCLTLPKTKSSSSRPQSSRRSLRQIIDPKSPTKQVRVSNASEENNAVLNVPKNSGELCALVLI